MNFPPNAAENLIKHTLYQENIKSIYRWCLKLLTGSKYSDMEEQKVIEDIISEATAEDIIYDIGAAGGLYSYYPVKDIGCTAHAFEPHPKSYEGLVERVNGINSITAHQVALSDFSGSVSFTENSNNKASPSIAVGPNTESEVVKVNCEIGDKYIQDKLLPDPTIVKVDVEGAEMNVLHGLKNTLSNSKCRLVYVEVHLPADDDSPDITDFGHQPDEIAEFLESIGYDTTKLFERDRDFHIKGISN